MRPNTPRPVVLLGLLAALVALAAAAPAAPARAEESTAPELYAWSIAASFAGGAPLVTVTRYTALLDPPHILDSATEDISADCVPVGRGSITYQQGKALFDGQSALRCELPPTFLAPPDCETLASPFFFFGADVTLSAASQANPLLAASDGSFAFGAPSTGVQGRALVRLPGQQYQSDPWPRDAAGNRLLIGRDGPMMIEASTLPAVLDTLPADWQPFFQGVSARRVGNWANWASGTQTWATPAANTPYRNPPSYVFIGYNPASGAFFSGEMAYVEGDPPGCTPK